MALPQKPNIGQKATFRFLTKVDVLMTGVVLRYIVDTESRWKAEIKVDKVGGKDGYAYKQQWLGRTMMFEHYDIFAIEDVRINPYAVMLAEEEERHEQN